MKKKNINLDLETSILIFNLGLKLERKKEYTIENADEKVVYLFNNRDEFISYFSEYGLEDKDVLDNCIIKETSKGIIIASKKLCDYTISKYLISRVKRGVSLDEMNKIHARGCLTPLEKVQEWECYGICAPSDDVYSLTNRCECFSNCYDCLLHYASSFNEYEPTEINPELVRKQECSINKK